MSRYNLTNEEEKHEQLVDLVRVYDKTLSEILFLEGHLNMTKHSIIELMEELDIDRFGKVKLIEKETIFVDPQGIANEPHVGEHAVISINEHATVGRLYENNMNYRIAQDLVKKAIKKHTVHTVKEKTIEF